MARPSKYVSRADLGWGASPATSANPRSGLVIHYDAANQNLANRDHSACLTYWRNTRNFHIGTNGWADIGYSWGACAHGYILEGRGLFRTQAAQPGGNSSHYSCTLMTGPTDTITAEQINAVRRLRQWLMEPESSISGTVLGHRDFIATSCPGDKAYRMVQDGTFAKAPDDSEGDDDMPDRNLYATTSGYTQTIPAEEWTTIRFDRIFRDGSWEEKTPEPSFVFGPSLYSASVGVRVDGLTAGQEFQIRLAYYRESDTGGWERYATMPIDSPVHDVGQGHFTTSWNGSVAGSRRGRVRVEVIHYGADDQNVEVTFARAEALVWRG